MYVVAADVETLGTSQDSLTSLMPRSRDVLRGSPFTQERPASSPAQHSSDDVSFSRTYAVLHVFSVRSVVIVYMYMAFICTHTVHIIDVLVHTST